MPSPDPARDPAPAAPEALISVADPLAALALLTRLPLPGARVATAARRGAAAGWAYPLAGAVIGAGAGLVLAAASALGLGAGPAAGLALAGAILATGALHEDGLADAADGLWGGWTPERRLEIMKDSRIGSYGVLALVLSLLLRWSCLAPLAADSPLLAALALVAVGAASRAALLLPFALLPPARPGGLAARTGRPRPATVAAGWILAAVLALAALGPAGLAVLAAAALAGIAATAIARMKIGGQTGDILGATQQLAEIAGLLVLAALA